MRRLLLISCVCAAWLTAGNGSASELMKPRLQELKCEVNPSMLALLELTNKARAVSRKCGRDKFRAAQSLSIRCELNQAAQRHADDLAANQTLTHVGSDGSSFTDRIEDAGFNWQRAAENIGQSFENSKVASEHWLASSAHCANIMGQSYQFFGSARQGDYWVVLFAR